MNPNSQPTWPRRFRLFRMFGILLSLACGALLIRAWVVLKATPLQRFYFPTYIRLTVFPDLPSLPKLGHKRAAGRPFPVVFAGQTPATDSSLARGMGKISISAARAPSLCRVVANVYIRWPLGLQRGSVAAEWIRFVSNCFRCNRSPARPLARFRSPQRTALARDWTDQPLAL